MGKPKRKRFIYPKGLFKYSNTPLLRYSPFQNKPGKCVSTGANNNEMTDINLSMILSDGPAVSFIGSPVVSPTTAALWASDPFPPN